MTPASCDTFANLSNEATRISGQKSQHGEEAKMQVDALACSAAQFARSKINNATVNSLHLYAKLGVVQPPTIRTPVHSLAFLCHLKVFFRESCILRCTRARYCLTGTGASHNTSWNVDCRGTLARLSLGNEFITDVVQVEYFEPSEDFDSSRGWR